jgi:hypothetical protein
MIFPLPAEVEATGFTTFCSSSASVCSAFARLAGVASVASSFRFGVLVASRGGGAGVVAVLRVRRAGMLSEECFVVDSKEARESSSYGVVTSFDSGVPSLEGHPNRLQTLSQKF